LCGGCGSRGRRAGGRFRPPLAGGARVRGRALAPDGHTLAVAAGGSVRLFDARTGALTARHDGADALVWQVAFDPKGPTLAVAALGPSVAFLSASGLRAALSPEGRGAPGRGVAFRPDGKTLAAGDSDHVVRLWRRVPPP